MSKIDHVNNTDRPIDNSENRNFALIVLLLVIGAVCFLTKGRLFEKPKVDFDTSEPFKIELSSLSLREKILFEYVAISHDETSILGKFPYLPAAIIRHETANLTSALYTKSNNMFGIKCFGKCNDSNSVIFADDNPDDRFRKYPTRWASYSDFRSLMVRKYWECFDLGSREECLTCIHGKGYATPRS